MKQIIVLIATIVLGISLSGVVMGMGGSVDDLADSVESKMETVITSQAGITL